MFKNLLSFASNLIGGVGGQVYIYFALVLGGFGAGFYVDHLRFVNYQNKIALVAQKQEIETAAKKKEAELITKGVQDAYEARIANIHAMYSRMHDTSSGAMSSVPSATITVNGEAHNVLLVAEQWAQTTQQLVSLQDWINQQMSIYEH